MFLSFLRFFPPLPPLTSLIEYCFRIEAVDYSQNMFTLTYKNQRVDVDTTLLSPLTEFRQGHVYQVVGVIKTIPPLGRHIVGGKYINNVDTLDLALYHETREELRKFLDSHMKQ